MHHQPPAAPAPARPPDAAGTTKPAPMAPFGAQLSATGGVTFRLWAPGCQDVQLELVSRPDRPAAQAWPMTPLDGGWHERFVPHAGAGTLYRFRVLDDLVVPDPASRHNPFDVHGPSEVIDTTAYRWGDAAWRGLAWEQAVIYELHVGTFTPEGRLASAARRLPELAALGISAIELMPLADFAGARGWGYDGVLPYAVENVYGRPDDLKRFVDTAHGLGMMVLLDVVYNHFGPDGNYLSAWCREFFNPAHQTPWGPAINFDGPRNETVRRFFVENALHWVTEYHLDGLRLDAVHAIRDDSPQHIVAEIGAALQRGPGRERAVHLVLENDANTAGWLARGIGDGAALVGRAQWNDDFHHAAHVIATREVDGYYADYAERPVALLGRALAEGFVYQGQPSASRGGEARGEPSGHLPSSAFIDFLQTHDQIGNRAFGERLDALATSPERVEALLSCLLLAPAVPMLFMGEEFAASTPFLYFCDFHGELGAAVAAGRAREFAAFAAFAQGTDGARRLADPNDVATFRASTLRWQERDTPAGQRRLALVQRLLTLRREQLMPRLAAQRRGGVLQCNGDAFEVDWTLGAAHWILRANFGPADVEMPAGADELELFARGVAGSGAGTLRLAPNGVQVSLRHP